MFTLTIELALTVYIVMDHVSHTLSMVYSENKAVGFSTPWFNDN